MPKKKSSRKKKRAEQDIIYTPTILALLIFLMLIIFAISIFISLPKHVHTKIKTVNRPIPTPTSTPTPPVHLSLVNTWKTYQNNEYGFTITYPALGLNKQGSLIDCGNGIEDFIKTYNLNDKIVPTIQLDNLLSLTLHPWGSELKDYVLAKDDKAYTKYSIFHTHMANADEVMLFSKNLSASDSATGYFADTLALYKKQNIIFQIQKAPSPQLGCQMIFDPRDKNQTQVFPEQLSQKMEPLQALLYNQYKSWNEAQSILFGSEMKPTGQD